MNAEVKPGYKLTEVGVIPEDWDVKPLATVVNYTNGKAHEQSITDSGRFVVVNSKFISSEGFTRKYCEECFCPTAKGDVLMVMSDVPNGRAIAKCFWVDSDSTYTVNQRICVLNPKEIDGEFLFYKLDRNPFYLTFDDGAKQTNLRREDVLSCPLALPNSETEQRAIAEALSNADALIESLEQLIAKKRQIKQGAMQELLTGKKRLPGFSGEWAVKRLGDLFSFSGGYSASRDQLSSEGHCYLHYGDIHGSSKMIIDAKEDYQNIPKLNIPLKRIVSNSLLEDGDVVFVDASEDDEGTSKYIVVVNKDDIPFIAGLHTIVAKSKTSELTHEYPRYCFQTASVHQQFLFFAVGTKVSGISKSNIPKLTLPVPPYPEQAAIAEILMDMDSEIDVLEVKLEKARQLKQGMMHNLLTGKIRLL